MNPWGRNLALAVLIAVLVGRGSEAQQAPTPTSPAAVTPSAITDVASTEGRVTLDFRDADILSVLRILSLKSGLNIVADEAVKGVVTIRLVDVPWEQALDVILRTYGYAYEREDNIIMVTTSEKLIEQKKALKEYQEIQPIETRVFMLKFMDAGDAKKLLEPQLSPQGKITVYEVESRKGWSFTGFSGSGGGGVSGASVTALEGGEERSAARSKALIISDIPTYLDRIAEIIAKLDTKPKQILIEARIMEVNRDRLKELGLEFGSGLTGAGEPSSLGDLRNKETALRRDISDMGQRTTKMTGALQSLSLGASATSVSNPATSGLTALNAGFSFLLRKVKGGEFEALIRALEETVDANTLSAPRILTRDGQQAMILVGEKFPILEAQVTGTTSTTTTSTLSGYQDIGIQLAVTPQVNEEPETGRRFIDMIVHPAISEVKSIITATGSAQYPRLNIREAEAQIVVEEGETIVIGGLLKDVKKESKIGIPILSDIPLLGLLFQRRATDIEKIDLLIFLTAHILEPGELSPMEEAALQAQHLAAAPASATANSASVQPPAAPDAPAAPQDVRAVKPPRQTGQTQ